MGAEADSFPDHLKLANTEQFLDENWEDLMAYESPVSSARLLSDRSTQQNHEMGPSRGGSVSSGFARESNPSTYFESLTSASEKPGPECTGIYSAAWDDSGCRVASIPTQPGRSSLDCFGHPRTSPGEEDHFNRIRGAISESGKLSAQDRYPQGRGPSAVTNVDCASLDPAYDAHPCARNGSTGETSVSLGALREANEYRVPSSSAPEYDLHGSVRTCPSSAQPDSNIHAWCQPPSHLKTEGDEVFWQYHGAVGIHQKTTVRSQGPSRQCSLPTLNAASLPKQQTHVGASRPISMEGLLGAVETGGFEGQKSVPLLPSRSDSISTGRVSMSQAGTLHRSPCAPQTSLDQNTQDPHQEPKKSPGSRSKKLSKAESIAGGRRPAMDPRLDPSIDSKKARRILANRASAARSYQKKREALRKAVTEKSKVFGFRADQVASTISTVKLQGMQLPTITTSLDLVTPRNVNRSSLRSTPASSSNLVNHFPGLSLNRADSDPPRGNANISPHQPPGSCPAVASQMRDCVVSSPPSELDSNRYIQQQGTDAITNHWPGFHIFPRDHQSTPTPASGAGASRLSDSLGNPDLDHRMGRPLGMMPGSFISSSYATNFTCEGSESPEDYLDSMIDEHIFDDLVFDPPDKMPGWRDSHWSSGC